MYTGGPWTRGVEARIETYHKPLDLVPTSIVRGPNSSFTLLPGPSLTPASFVIAYTETGVSTNHVPDLLSPHGTPQTS